MFNMPKLKIENVQIKGNSEIAQNFNDWNSIQNHYNLKTIDPDLKFPKYLLINALREMNSFCESAFIDASKYQYVDVTKMYCTYQVDFFSNEKMNSPKISVYDIYYDSKRKVIMQSCIGLD